MRAPFAAQRSRRQLVLALMGFLLLGCDRSSRSLSLDEDQARAACTAFLTAWKQGKKPDDLRPQITGRDYSWDSGHTLKEFEILPDESSDGTNLHMSVRLSLQDANGKESKSDAIYTVGTSPVVTIFRK